MQIPLSAYDTGAGIDWRLYILCGCFRPPEIRREHFDNSKVLPGQGRLSEMQ